MSIIKYVLLPVIVSFIYLSCESMILNPDEIKPPLPVIHESRLETILDSLRYALDLPALAGAIVNENGIIEAQAVGCRRYGGAANVTINDQFHLGSCGKVFTAALMGILVDEGLVDWNTTLAEIYPEFNDIIRNEYREVTVKDLLSHSAGFIRDHDVKLKSENLKEQRIEMVEWALKQPPVSPHGTHLYSNLGFMIAGAIIEKLSNRNYEELMMEKILAPLGITTAGFGAMGTSGKEDQPLQHSALHAPIIATSNASFHPIVNPAGGLYMSIGDWGKFCQWLLQIESGHQTLLQDITARMIISPVVPDRNAFYGLGIGVILSHGQKYLTHSGSNGYNYSMVELQTNGIGLIVMTNQGVAEVNPPLSFVMQRMAKYFTTGN